MSKRLYVGNLAYSVTSAQLHDLFAQFGEVIEANLITDRMTGRSKGFAFVEMADDEGSQKAIEGLNDRNVGGRNMVVNEARERDAAPVARSGFGGRGRGRGR